MMAVATICGSLIGASSTNHTPSPLPSSISAAACRASRVLPEPPAPERVIMRCSWTSALISATSTTRPTKGFSEAGRLLGSSGLSSDRNGAKSLRRPGARAGISPQGVRGPSGGGRRGFEVSRRRGASPRRGRPSPTRAEPVRRGQRRRCAPLGGPRSRRGPWTLPRPLPCGYPSAP